MTPSRDSCSGYDSFWAEVEATAPRAKQPDPTDAYAAFTAEVEE